MHPRIILAVLAIAAIAQTVHAPAQAGQPGSHAVTSFCGDRVCSLADPTAPAGSDRVIVPRPGRQAASRKRSAVLTSLSPSGAGQHAGRPSVAKPMGDAGRTPDRVPEVGVVAGIVRSHKTGATARVRPSFAPTAQAVVDDLESRGAIIRFMGGYRKGPCANYSLHPCGYAIDLCQTRRGVVDPRCNMPSRSTENEIARAHGAYSGGEWCNQDRGHVQKLETASKCGGNLYAAVQGFKRRTAARHRHHYARL